MTPFKRGKNSYDRDEFESAVGHFQESLPKAKNKALVNKYIAESYRKSNRMSEATPFYEAALQGNTNDDDVRFYYAYALKAQGNYEKARERFELYANTSSDRDRVRLARKEVESFGEIQELLEKKTFFDVESCPGINTSAEEFAPVVHDGQLLFTSTRKNGTYPGDGLNFSGIYVYEFKNKDNCQGSHRLYDPVINLSGANEGIPAFSKDGSFMIFARSSTGEKGEADDVHLYITRQSEAGWSEPEILPYPINISKKLYEEGEIPELRGSREDAWTSCPSITPDGKRLYFASDRAGGYGGIDIWRAEIRGTRITGIRNLGPTVNTPGDELFPVVSEEGKLYFASNGHTGIGGLDLFEAKRKDGKTTIVNLGKPINSQKDDFAMVFETDSTGYFSSNREGGSGGDDIYKFFDRTPQNKIVNLFLEITVVGYDPVDSTTSPLPNANLDIYLGDELNRGDKIHTYQADKNGKIAAFPVDARTDYLFIGNAGYDYLVEETEYTTHGKEPDYEEITEPVTNITLKTEVILEKKVINYVKEIEINFDFNKFNIRPDAAKILDKFVKFLQDNPDLIVEMGSHTDAVGTEYNNLILSKNRANSTVEYLVSKGIDPSRLQAKGYGETQLKIPTQDPEERNRRTEAKILRIDESRRR